MPKEIQEKLDELNCMVQFYYYAITMLNETNLYGVVV